MTNYLPVVIAAKYLEDYKIEVEFNNGEKRRVDCEKWLTGGIFTPLRDKNYFKQFFVAMVRTVLTRNSTQAARLRVVAKELNPV